MRTMGLIGCLAFASLAGCGTNDTSAPPGGTTLVGTWKASLTDMGGGTTTYTLVITGTDASGNVHFTLASTHPTAAGDPQSACVTIENATGTFTSSNGQITVVFTAGTLAVTSCADMTKNMAETALTAMQLTELNGHAGGAYTVTATTLTITSGGMAFVFTRQ